MIDNFQHVQLTQEEAAELAEITQILNSIIAKLENEQTRHVKLVQRDDKTPSLLVLN